MRTSTSTTTLEPASAMNRRQPLRQTRTNPSKHGSMVPRVAGAQAFSGQSPDVEAPADDVGFYPAITHFSDAIIALPKEMIRHSTMLKEVDAKIYSPEETLKKIAADLLAQPFISQGGGHHTRGNVQARKRPHAAIDTFQGDNVAGKIISRKAGPGSAVSNLQRREKFLRLQMCLRDILPTLDEKIHVLSTANDALDKQLGRCQGSFREIDNEISAITRHGSLSHWAYNDKSSEKKGTTAGERTRREAAQVNVTTTMANGDADLGPKRDNMTTRKRVNQHHHAGDSDFDADRSAKRTTGAGKGKKVADITSVGENMALINGSTNAANKRRKLEKPGITGLGGQPMERSLSGLFGSARGGAASPHESNAVDVKKRGRGGSTSITGPARRRNASAAHSPATASSPVVGTFSASVRGGNGMTTGAMQRTLSSRARQNSIHEKPKELPLSLSKERNGPPLPPIESEKRPSSALKPTIEPIKVKGEDLTPAETDTRTSSRSNERVTVRREESATATTQSRPPSIATSGRAAKASKTSTPVASSFPDPSARTRPGRSGNAPSDLPIKRSHKKGAGLAAQMAALQRSKDREGSGGSIIGDGIDDDDEETAEEKRYCYCNGVSYGEMVACDHDGCKREWFHLECANLARAPTGKAKWYCEDCKKLMKTT